MWRCRANRWDRIETVSHFHHFQSQFVILSKRVFFPSNFSINRLKTPPNWYVKKIQSIPVNNREYDRPSGSTQSHHTWKHQCCVLPFLWYSRFSSILKISNVVNTFNLDNIAHSLQVFKRLCFGFFLVTFVSADSKVSER